jgi:hypothetical protein
MKDSRGVHCPVPTLSNASDVVSFEGSGVRGGFDVAMGTAQGTAHGLVFIASTGFQILTK